MLRVRSVPTVEEFAPAPGDPADFPSQVQTLWESGESRPDRCFVLEEEGERIGRIGYRVTPTVSDPAWLGSLPPSELSAFGLQLPWNGEYLPLARVLLGRSVRRLRGSVPDVLEMRVHKEVHPHPDLRVRLLEACGLELFQEKQGFYWREGGTPVSVPERLRFRSIIETGEDAFREVMAQAGAGTLDRNDRWYWSHMRPQDWSSQMLEYLEPEDAATWMLGFDSAGRAVGYVAISSFDEPETATITHIGVVPGQRGNGYVGDLLTAGTRAAQRAGFRAIISDVDTQNLPMMEAMRRAGHRDDARPWHVWVYRGDLSDIEAACRAD